MTDSITAMSISDIAERTGLSAHTLRYYEREGLMLSPVERASSSHRRYSEADLTWVLFLTKLRSTAMPIATVRRYVELARRGDDTTAERLELLLLHRMTVVRQLEEMTASLAAIDHKIGLYEKKTGTNA
ncbi:MULTISPECIES: MerR family transcriptional regulator [Leifsonia]|jgi:DNA-binding transcriptional MerR regulator|uniref:DNA-binding transcriptional MerR regulator n=3 Tax=Leifsonia TaxID=110932 RepID=A0A7W4UW41_LEIAQ|nr:MULTISPECIES: MerR family transcriptional regulator [Leifsonia]ERK72643.1 putative HTH-type transcriptional regulator AdhR [Leifsonia aquatica ATCC 14665]MBB2966691.1 DNA-binding transcriptional MerR regulator [Leifsonia aquatica]NYK11545.1 DNA-binding transcriptional MerR regulator [Leifsonia naganoensis]